MITAETLRNFAFWDARQCSQLADLGDVEGVTEKINGPAKLGLLERRAAR